MLGQVAKPTIRAICRLRAMSDTRRVLVGVGGILGIAGLVGAIGTIRALPILRRDRSEDEQRAGWLRRKLSRQRKE